jgi:shikimate dehydrogenase
MDFLDGIDETAKAIGAVNTIVNEQGRLTGYNTDYYGAVSALKEKTSLSGKKILIIGAGGAARALVYGFKKENSEITVINRTKEKAQKLADEFEIKSDELSNAKNLINANDIIINTTSIGMHPNAGESIIKEDEFVSGKLVMDIVYNPLKTKFVENAQKAGCEVIMGDKMLIYQAAGQFELWTKNRPEFEEMQNALQRAIRGDL